jgi:Fe-S cluster assembly ATP-binding protein
LTYIQPTFIHVMLDGKIVRSGGPEVAAELEAGGYDALREEFPAPVAV